MKLLTKTTLLLCLLFWLSTYNAQTYTIDQGGSVSSCVGTFTDSDGAGNYLDNENYTFTICSDGTAGANIINLGFATLFDIDPSDTLFIYDGNSTAAPLIGAYNNNNIPGGISSTTSNTSGCLTFLFISDGAINSPGWSASIGCIKICQPIIPTITTVPALVSYGPDSNYTNICPGDTVLFSATGMYPDTGVNPLNYTQNDATSTFEWTLGTGIPFNTQNASEFYPDAQGYLIVLTMTDANGCIETVKHKVRTGILPIFSGIMAQPDTACFADTITLVGGFNQVTSSTAGGVTTGTGVVSAGGTVAGQTYLPDGNGQSYTTSVNISGFSGQNIMQGTDITEVCMNIEHSYIGDLDITLTCPNGTSIFLMDTYGGTGPGNTFLGDAQDNFAVGNGVPGIGMDYCFNLGAAWGTMTAENIAGNYIPATVTPGNNILTPGSFQPLQSFNSLVGCPIDGNWTITVTDNIGIDDGFIFEWSLLLNPAINPNSEFYTVNLLNGIWQSNPDIINDFDTIAYTLPSSAGYNPYTFRVTDDFGCNFDTTIQIIVLPELYPTASLDTLVCVGQPVTLDVNTIDSCNYTLELLDAYGNGWNNAQLSLSINGVPFLTNETVPDCNGSTLTGCAVSFSIPITTGDIITMNYTAGTFNIENSINLYNSFGAQIFTINDPSNGTIGGNITANCAGLLDYVWSPATALNNSNIKTPTFDGSATNSYTATISHSIFPQCNATSDTITLDVVNDSLPTLIGDTVFCIGETVNLEVSDGHSFLWSGGDTTASVSFVPPADTLVTVNVTSFCGNFDFSRAVIVVNNPLPIIFGDTMVCIGDDATLAIGSSTDYTWPDSSTTSPVTFTPTVDTTITLIASNFCDTVTLNHLVIVKNEPTPQIIGDSIVCFGDEVMLSITDAMLYSWPDSSTNSSVNFIATNDSLILATVSNYCDTFDINRNLTVNPNPIFTLSSDTTIILQDSAFINFSSPDSIVNYFWSPQENLDCPNCPNPIATPEVSTSYTLEVTDTNGCITSKTINIEVLIPDLFIPTGFSPNNDGVNDAVLVRSLDIDEMILQIYNRWGNLVFETEDQTIGWDGTYNGQELDLGVYVYKFEATLLGGEKISKSGSITLFR